METYQDKFKELANFLVNMDVVDRVFEQEETRQLLVIFKRRTTVDYNSSRIKLISQTEEQTQYDIHFYKDGVKIKEQRLLDQTTLDKSTFIDGFIKQHYPELAKPPRVRKAKKKINFDPAEYMINFGKHSGRKIIHLTSQEDIQYCEWMVKKLRLAPRVSNKLRAFEWHLEQMKKGA